MGRQDSQFIRIKLAEERSELKYDRGEDVSFDHAERRFKVIIYESLIPATLNNYGIKVRGI